MKLMNEMLLSLFDFIGGPEGWGREQGRNAYPLLLKFVEHNPGSLIFRISVSKVQRMDMSFMSETVIQLARRYNGSKGFFCVENKPLNPGELNMYITESGDFLASGSLASVNQSLRDRMKGDLHCEY